MKSDRKKLEDKVWNECKRVTRKRHGDKCYTCGASNLEGSNWHTGHGKPKGALSVKYKYDLRNLRPQCMLCNIHRGGMSDIFITKLEKEQEGLSFLEECCTQTDEGWIIKHGDTMGGKDATFFLENLLKEYKQL
jgi:hypothetical protein